MGGGGVYDAMCDLMSTYGAEGEAPISGKVFIIMVPCWHVCAKLIQKLYQIDFYYIENESHAWFGSCHS